MQNTDHLHRQEHIGPIWLQEFICNYLFIKQIQIIPDVKIPEVLVFRNYIYVYIHI